MSTQPTPATTNTRPITASGIRPLDTLQRPENDHLSRTGALTVQSRLPGRGREKARFIVHLHDDDANPGGYRRWTLAELIREGYTELHRDGLLVGWLRED